MLSAFLPETFIPPESSTIHHIIWNVVLTDKLTQLTKDIIDKNKIKHILAILPHKDDFLKLNIDIPDVSFDVLEYGSNHDTNINFEEYDILCRKIDNIARYSGDRNVLLFCNNGFQRSFPFLNYYLIKDKNLNFNCFSLFCFISKRFPS